MLQPVVTISAWRLWCRVEPALMPPTSGGALLCTTLLRLTSTGGELGPAEVNEGLSAQQLRVKPQTCQGGATGDLNVFESNWPCANTGAVPTG